MGYGDEIIGTGIAKGMHSNKLLAAFGDRQKIIWGPWCEEMFANNPNIARPGSEHRDNLVWIAHYKGARAYNKLQNGRWVWNYKFKVSPGEFFFSDIERRAANSALSGFICIEPNVPWHKSVAPNKDWGEQKYQQLCEQLIKRGHRVMQFIHKNSRYRLRGVSTIELQRFRDVIAHLSLMRLYIGPEGGMHHAAAAVGVRAVVIMGGFIPAAVVGYDAHLNLTGGAEACGSLNACSHCRQALDRISVDEVLIAATDILDGIR